MIWVLLFILILSMSFNIFVIWTSRLQTREHNKHLQILTVKYNIILDKYNVMVDFLDVIIKNPRYTQAFLEFDPVVSEILNKIKDFHNTLVSLSDGNPDMYYRENNDPDEIDRGENER